VPTSVIISSITIWLSPIGPLGEWMEKCWQECGGGVRRKSMEHLYMWCRLESVGILTAVQKDWFTSFITKKLWDFKTNGIVIFVNFNRCEEIKVERASPAKSSDMLTNLEKVELDSDESEGENMSVRDTNREFQKDFEKASRNLIVKDIRVNFKEATIYGQRKGWVDGFAVVANHDNVYRKSMLWRRGVVHDVDMLPRKEQRKCAAKGNSKEDAGSKLGLGMGLTQVQTAKQHTAGYSFFNEIFDKFHNHMKLPDKAGVVCLDLFGYDAWSAESMFQRSTTCAGLRVCGTVCHSTDTYKYVHNAISRVVYTTTRSGGFTIPGFPRFDVLINALKQETPAIDVQFDVCTLLPCGALVLNETLTAQWLGNDAVKEDLREITTPAPNISGGLQTIFEVLEFSFPHLCL
jgi:hypothetical protein